MHSKVIIILLSIAAFLLALFHDLAIRLSWYYYYPMMDIPLHLLGGFVIGLFVYVITAAVQHHVGQEVSAKYQLVAMLFGTLGVALAWEIFELAFHLTNDAGLSLETSSDILFGLVGGTLAWMVVYYLHNKKPRR